MFSKKSLGSTIEEIRALRRAMSEADENVVDFLANDSFADIEPNPSASHIRSFFLASRTKKDRT